MPLSTISKQCLIFVFRHVYTAILLLSVVQLLLVVIEGRKDQVVDAKDKNITNSWNALIGKEGDKCCY